MTKSELPPEGVPDKAPLYELPNTTTKKQTIDSLQKDIETGNAYRMEGLKQMLTLAAGLLAFTVSFRPTLKAVTWEWLIWFGWGGLGVSVVCGIGVMMCWERFYLSYRKDWHDKEAQGKRLRKRLNGLRIFLLVLQVLAFGCGVIGVALFAALNFHNVIPSGH